MTKLKRFLNFVVIAYLIYAVFKDGLSPSLLALLILFLFVAVMQWWMGSDLRRKMEKQGRRKK